MMAFTIGQYTVDVTAYDVTNEDGWLQGTVNATFTETGYRSNTHDVEVQCGACMDDCGIAEWSHEHEGARLLLAMLGQDHSGELAGHPITKLMPEDCDALGRAVASALREAAAEAAA